MCYSRQVPCRLAAIVSALALIRQSLRVALADDDRPQDALTRMSLIIEARRTFIWVSACCICSTQRERSSINYFA